MAEDRPGRVEQLRAAFALTRKHDPRLIPLMLAAALPVLAALVLIGVFVHFTFHLVVGPVFGVLCALLAAATVFGRRAQSVMYAQVEGQPGASYGLVSGMRGGWRVSEQPSAVTRSQDLVFRVVGRPGVVVVGEGARSRVGNLIAQERKRVGRVAGEVPVYEVSVGNEEGQVPLRRLQSHLMKLPRNLKPAEVAAVEARLRALGSAGLPIPKGPMPRNVRVPRRPR